MNAHAAHVFIASRLGVSRNNMSDTITSPALRRKPSHETIIRMPLSSGGFAYALVCFGVEVWVFDFVTKEPARGTGYFPVDRCRFAADLGDCAATFVNCGKMDAEIVEAIPAPKLYMILTDMNRQLTGLTSKYATYGALFDAKPLAEEDIQREGMQLRRWLDWKSYEGLIHEWRPQMELRDVPEEFLDREAMRKMAAGEPVMEKPLPKQEVELVVIIPVQGDDPALDEPEEQFEEPLSEALEEAECGSCTSSGTTPDSFDIDVDTVKPSLRRCLSVIRRVLKKAGAPAATIIRQLPDNPDDPPIDHPLEAPPAAPKKAARK